MDSSVLKLIREQLGDSQLVCQVDPGWSSKTNEHRQILRAALFDKLQALDWNPTEDIKTPGTSHQFSDLHYSISHCPTAGGYICLSPGNNENIGFDLEDPKRVTSANVGRISTSEEVDLAPDPASLWVAKEAFYKSLPRSIQAPVIGQVEIHKWLTLEKNLYTFWGTQNGPQQFHNSQGLVVAFDGLKMGFCTFRT